MATNPITGATEPVYGQLGDEYVEGSLRTPQKSLDQSDFLKLLVTQMTSQDPMAPKGDLDFIGQMASFTSLDQTRAMISDLAVMRSDQELLKANALIGRTVEIATDDSGTHRFGTVTAVNMETGKSPTVIVGGTAYGLDQLRTITLPGSPA
jgi:flagellar basal-body rod modification protein FlgD